jgi:hypothetical protein
MFYGRNLIKYKYPHKSDGRFIKINKNIMEIDLYEECLN